MLPIASARIVLRLRRIVMSDLRGVSLFTMYLLSYTLPSVNGKDSQKERKMEISGNGAIMQTDHATYWSVKHVAHLYGIDPQTVRRAYRTGELPFIRHGKGLKIWIPSKTAILWGKAFE